MRRTLIGVLITILWFGCEDSLLNPISGKAPLKFVDYYNNPIDWISFSPDGKFLITASPEGGYYNDYYIYSNILVRNNGTFDTAVYQITDTLFYTSYNRILAFSCILTKNFISSKKYFIVGSKGGVKMYEFSTTGSAKLFNNFTMSGYVTDMALYNDSLLIAGNSVGTILVYDLKNSRTLKTISGSHSGSISGIEITQNGKSFITSSYDNTIIFWRTSDWKALHYQYHDNSVTGISMSPNEKYLVSVGLDKKIHIWDPISSNWIRTINYPDWVNATAFSPDKKTFAVGGDDNIVTLYDISTGKVVATINEHKKRILALAYSIDGKYLASSAADKTFIITEMK